MNPNYWEDQEKYRIHVRETFRVSHGVRACEWAVVILSWGLDDRALRILFRSDEDVRAKLESFKQKFDEVNKLIGF